MSAQLDLIDNVVENKFPAGAFLDPDAIQGIKIGYLIHDVSRLRKSLFFQLVKPLGLTPEQWFVMESLAVSDGLKQTELAKLLDIGKSGISSLLVRLESGGFVDRSMDPVDHRVTRVFLTPKSLQMLEQISPLEEHFNLEVMSCIGDDGKSALLRLLTQMKDSINKVIDGDVTCQSS